MALATVRSIALVGVEGHVIEVEAHLAQGLPATVIVGLPDAAVSEARDRVRAAVINSGEVWPPNRITLGLSPASLPKHGSGFDLAVAAAVLCAAGALPAEPFADAVVLGELGLDGRVRPVRGVLPALLAARRAGVSRAMVPAANVAEACLVPDIVAVGVGSLRELAAILRGEAPEPVAVPAPADVVPSTLDLADVAGQDLGRLAIEVAAAGGHHLFLLGPPGAGKTMLAERLPGLLPELDADTAIEVTAVHSVAGVLPSGAGLVRWAPYQAPHHSASTAALVGGGSGLAKPGAVSLAHRGVLFLDEAPEFATGVLDALRQPLERGEVVLARSGGITRYPSAVQLVLAANPCPCASPVPDGCQCTPTARRRYAGKLSGPLVDRVDLRVELPPVRGAALLADAQVGESTEVVRARVSKARARATSRWSAHGWRTNAEIPATALRGEGRLPRSATALADRAVETGAITARGYHRILRVAWTLSDLAGHEVPGVDEVDLAVGLRTGWAA